MEKNNGKEKRARELFAKEVQEEKTNKGWKYSRNLLEIIIDSLVTIGPDGIITDVNSATEKATGLPREKIIGTDFSEYFTDPDKALAGYKQVFDAGKVVDYELYLKHINGSSIPVLYNASVYKDNKGQIIGVLAVARDISAIKKYKDELTDFKNNLELIVQQKTAELIIANEELVFQNEEKEKRAAELVIANKELAFQNEEKADRAAELLIVNKELVFLNEEKEKRAAELIIANEELVFQNEEKEKRAAELLIANKELSFQNKEKVRWKVHTKELKEQNVELEIQKKQLDEASQLKSSFLSNMSHELRTPLNAIVGFSELALKTSLNPRQHNYLSKIKISSHILLRLISDILDLSKIEAGKLELEIATFSLEEVLQNAVNQVSVKSQEKGLTLMVSIDEDVPLSLNGDSLRLGQILLNLVSNAIKFTDKGEVAIRVELLEKSGDSASIQFSIKDTGIGMTEEQVTKLFQPFTQADTSTTRKYGGTGLGLDISKKLVSLMSGDIWIESEIGVGSTFFFTTKINVADKGQFEHYKNTFEKWGKKVLLVDDIEESREIIGSMLAEVFSGVVMSSFGEEAIAILEKTKENDIKYLPQLRDIRILLVEDNEINREMAWEILQEAGLKVTIANNGREAVDKVKTNAYDIVLMDIQMPIMDGYDATREIRKDPVFAELPIIAMTANASLRNREKCFQAGMNGYVAKPIDTAKLFQTIAHWMKKEQGTIRKKTTHGISASPSSKNKAVTENSIMIPDLAGIDVQTGLTRLGGNQKLYCELLVKFHKNHKYAVKEIRYALDHGDLKGAEILVHTIKGAAGNVGAQDVYIDSDALEAELKTNRPANVGLLLGKLEQALEQIFASIVLMAKNDEDTQSSHLNGEDTSHLKPILDKLKKLLLDNNMDAVEYVEKIVRLAKSTPFSEKATEMKGYAEQYDFEGALGILKEILNNIGEVSENEK
ncbi:MAG: response regulator [Eubacteriaceae bacterium]|nr:response regulator [Eubacteriaceae bacterium]